MMIHSTEDLKNAKAFKVSPYVEKDEWRKRKNLHEDKYTSKGVFPILDDPERLANLVAEHEEKVRKKKADKEAVAKSQPESYDFYEMEDIPADLVAYMQLRGITEKDLCERTGIDKGTVNKLLSGKIQAPSYKLVKIVVVGLGGTVRASVKVRINKETGEVV